MTRPALIRRLPRLRSRAVPEELLPEGAAAAYTELGPDVADVDALLRPDFERLDVLAGVAQNRHRRARLGVIVGGTVATVLGAIQSASDAASWPGIVGGILGAMLVGVGVVVQRRAHGRRYLQARLGAELLRGEAFRYLAHTGEYAAADRRRALRVRVARIVAESDG